MIRVHGQQQDTPSTRPMAAPSSLLHHLTSPLLSSQFSNPGSTHGRRVLETAATSLASDSRRKNQKEQVCFLLVVSTTLRSRFQNKTEFLHSSRKHSQKNLGRRLCICQMPSLICIQQHQNSEKIKCTNVNIQMKLKNIIKHRKTTYWDISGCCLSSCDHTPWYSIILNNVNADI